MRAVAARRPTLILRPLQGATAAFSLNVSNHAVVVGFIVCSDACASSGIRIHWSVSEHPFQLGLPV